jgi:RecA-family ATPase
MTGISASFHDQFDLVLSHLSGVRGDGDSRMACCPAHDDNNPSLSIKRAPDTKRGYVAHCFAGCSQEAVLGAIDRLTGGVPRIYALPSPRIPSRGPGASKLSYGTPEPKSKPEEFPDLNAAIARYSRTGKVTGCYTYRNESGYDVGTVLRIQLWNGEKTYRPLFNEGSKVVLGAMPEPRPIYNLFELSRTDPKYRNVFVVEGEKCAEALAEIGLLAVTSSGGAKAARKTNWAPLAGANICILPDNDEPGEDYCRDVIEALRLARVKSVSVLRLPGLPKGGDVVDWLANGGTFDKLLELVEATQLLPMEPPPDPDDQAERDAIREYEEEQERELKAQERVEPAYPPMAPGHEIVPKAPQSKPPETPEALQARIIQAYHAGGSIEELLRSVALTDQDPFGGEWFDEEKIDQLPETEWVIQDLIPKGGCTLLVAAPGAGKSLHAAEFALTLTHGLPWRNFKTTPGGVLICSAEKYRTWTGRLAAYRTYAKLPRKGKFPLEIVSRGPELGDEVKRAPSIETLILKYKIKHGQLPALIILDTLSICLGSANENDSAVVTPAIRALANASDKYGVAWAATHHTGKSMQSGVPVTGMDRVRGSTALTACFDSILTITEDSSKMLNLTQLKSSYGKREDGIISTAKIQEFPQNRTTKLGVPILDKMTGKPLVGPALVPASQAEADKALEEEEAKRSQALETAILEVFQKSEATKLDGILTDVLLDAVRVRIKSKFNPKAADLNKALRRLVNRRTIAQHKDRSYLDAYKPKGLTEEGRLEEARKIIKDYGITSGNGLCRLLTGERRPEGCDLPTERGKVLKLYKDATGQDEGETP